MYGVRYADDFKIFCRTYSTAPKCFAATKQWLDQKLHLKINNEKSTITNLRKKNSYFLGFSIRSYVSRKTIVCRTKITDKTKKKHQSKTSK